MKTDNHALKNAEAKLLSIVEEVEAYRAAADENSDDIMDEIQDHAQDGVLSVEVRTSWFIPGQDVKPDQFRLLLTWGGPACQIVGDLDEYSQPENIRLEYQDWGTKWQTLPVDGDEQSALDEFANWFYFGE